MLTIVYLLRSPICLFIVTVYLLLPSVNQIRLQDGVKQGVGFQLFVSRSPVLSKRFV